MTPDTREEFQTTEKATLDDYGIIAKINKRNRMRALNLMNGKYPGNGNKNGVSESLDEELDKRILKKIAKMTDNNYHTKALIAGADLIGEKKLVKRLELVDKLHNLEGHLTDGLYQYRYELHKELKRLAEKKLSKEDFEALISCF